MATTTAATTVSVETQIEACVHEISVIKICDIKLITCSHNCCVYLLFCIFFTESVVFGGGF